MKKIAQILVCLSLLSSHLFGQNVVNGDLEGVITGFSTLPPSWNSISSTDINCMADVGGTSPDLMSTTQPGSTSNGMIGTPYSGNTFMAGSYGGTQSGTFFHEGIIQNVSGFTIGENYIVKIHQSVVKTEYCADTSGSWMVILDNTIIGIPEVTVSHELFNSVSTNWEVRTVAFTATQSSYDLKFLPYDDDSNQVATIGDQGGCLFMGIDSISIQLNSGIGMAENDFGDALHLYPNPTDGNVIIDLGKNYRSIKIEMKDMSGIVLLSNSYHESRSLNLRIEEPAGIYILVVEADNKRAVIRLVKE